MQPRSYIWQMDGLTYAISNTHLSACSMLHTPQLRNLSLITTFTSQTHQSPSPPTAGPHAPARPPPVRVLGRHGASSIRCTCLVQGWTPTGHFPVSVAGPACDTDGGVCAMRSAVLRRRDDDTTGGMAVGGVGQQGTTDAGRTGNRTTGNRTDGRIGYVVEGIRSGRGRLKLTHAAWTRPGGHGFGSERRQDKPLK